ncbi:MAG: polysaccharide deacetylase family protein [Bacteroidota bacterium]
MTADLPLGIVVEAITPRLTYTLDTCLRDVLGMDYALFLPTDPRPDRLVPYLNYTRQPQPNCRPIACSGLLYEHDLRPGPWRFAADTTYSESDLLLKSDHFAYIFFRLTEYRHYVDPQFDSHGRYREVTGEVSVEQALALLDAQLASLYDPHNPPRNQPRFQYEITLDVDHPFKFAHKPAGVVLGGLLKDLLRGRWRLLRERWAYLRTGKDPFRDAVAAIKRLCPPERTRLFFLVGGNHPRDSRYDLRMASYRDYVQDFRESGYGIGLHPSYLTFQNAEQIATEKRRLESQVGTVEHSRQHYLRYRLPETFRYLCAAGIREEYTLCPVAGSGAKTGILRPYYWFDLEQDAVTPLRLHPAVVMDRNLQQYQGLDPEAALAEIRKWIAEVRKWNGKFVVILHNETFSESGEWQGWLPVIEAFTKELAEYES